MKVKNIFKKNQIIIFALAIMIAIAGYLNFSRDKTKESALEEAASSAVDDDLFPGVDGDSYADLPDISDEDLASSEASNDDILVVNDPVTTEDKIVDKDSKDKGVADGSKEDAKAADAEGKDVKAVDNEDAKATDATGGEKSEVETAAPGDAILASTTISSAYFSTARLTREQMRAKNTDRLMEIIADEKTSQKLKDKATNALMELTTISEKESSAEILLEAKGYPCVVTIVEGKVDAIINKTSLTDQDRAIIEDAVMRKTGAEAKEITITNVVTED